ncbi:hypothetical protein ACT3CE_17070 [Marinifilum sp. RC60d5]|uniref:hypothetical protein n=1 Tax=Marinifilum sp. RC60d5 TaxID=3458414 RepID=UPI004035A28A
MGQEDFDKIRKINKEGKEVFNPWSRDDDDKLINLFFDGVPVGEMAAKLNRSKGAVRARIRKMELTKIKKKDF